MNTKQKSIYTYYMENPCLSEPMDYESEEKRAKYYYKMVNEMSPEDIENEYEMHELEGHFEEN